MRVLFRLVGAILRLLFYPFFLLGWRRAARRGSYVTLEINGAVTDIRPPPRFFDRFRGPQPLSLHGLGELVDTLTADPRVRGMIVTLRSFRQGAASALSLRDLLRRARASGRDVVIHLPFGAGTQEIFIATGASRILAGPNTTLAPLGFLAQVRYLRGALDKAHLVPEVYARGRFKSAGEQLMRTSMSETEREQLEAILDHRYASLIEGITDGRIMDVERARAIVDGAPYLPKEAIAAGLIDGEAYDDEVAEVVKRGDIGEIKPGEGKEGERLRTVSAGRYLGARRALRLPRVLAEPVIGVIQVHGAIARQGLFAAQLGMATDEALLSLIRSARRDPRIRGVILHIDSPGGSALASDRIHHELVGLAADKPLVACMANVAASGGYYVAVAAHAIIAQPSTITGSIGVVAARVVIDPLLERLGVTTEVLKRGLRADLINPTRALRDDERVVLDREIEGIYRAFLSVVAAGRKLPIARVEEVAEGRIWTGADAKREGLVDELGGFDTALQAVRSRIGEGAARLRPAVLSPPRHAVRPLEPPQKKAAELLAGAAELARAAGVDIAPAALALCGDGERALVWCPAAASLA